MNSKILTLLGFASKSGRLACGFSAAKEALLKGKAKLFVAACDLSDKTLKEAMFHADKAGVQVLTLKNTDIFAFSHAVGHKCGIAAVNDDGFAKAIKEDFLNDQ